MGILTLLWRHQPKTDTTEAEAALARVTALDPVVDKAVADLEQATATLRAIFAEKRLARRDEVTR